ncbi:26S proteasome non-ATPase regulatory subunit 10-like protein [Euroglyphus maynei]|uniref:26S proteasome non-ATPase regulatory subunit 10-like protein n=1 Tax=Euroglyphus maynei TaxID=6958 RepID=A0A1Y3BRW7_EURMA|nr:26S proteasome non-ATPase regulatory subunit 10-like protein [Euroglyphus maynei]
MEWTPLIIAASAGHKDIVEYLVNKGADIDAATVNGQRPLHYAASKGWIDICRYLVESGATINVCDRLKQTPLHRSVSRGHEDIVRYFLSLPGIQINVSDIMGNTPLHLACEEERETIIKLLIQSGANIDSENKDKKRPIDLCTNQSFQRSIRNFMSSTNHSNQHQKP